MNIQEIKYLLILFLVPALLSIICISKLSAEETVTLQENMTFNIGKFTPDSQPVYLTENSYENNFKNPIPNIINKPREQNKYPLAAITFIIVTVGILASAGQDFNARVVFLLHRHIEIAQTP